MQSTQAKYISLLPNSIRKTSDFSSRNLAVNHSDPFSRNGILSHLHLHLQKPIVSAWKKKRRSGSVRSTKIMLESAYFIASKLKLLPEPLDSILREFGGGNGGGGGGGFSFGSGGFDGWGREK
uniref:Putative ovule protein n=1 Tax=Solanum chacoense TaxID=4108 RepID=A0A0V0GV70_SOLCH